MRRLLKPTTPEEWSVLVWTAIGALVLVGGVNLYCSFQVRPDDLVGVTKFRRGAVGGFGLAALTLLLRRAWLRWLG
ncbi:MAG: hypothetical protein QM775_20415 [Pirellulales bacterium]